MTERRRGRPAGSALALLVFAGVACAPSPGGAQVAELAGRCLQVGTLGGPTACQGAAVATRLAQAGVGLSLAGGNAFQGAASTLGRRFGASPRVAFAGRVGVTRFPVLDRFGGNTGSSSADWALATSFQGQVTVGVLDGFSPGPTVGGLLSLDLLANAGIALLPGGQGFQGNVASWGYGARVGIIRESFTLPGITLSATRRHGGEVDQGAGGLARVHLDDVVTTSLRMVVGKELMFGGILAGAGWDRYASDGEIRYVGPVLQVPPDPTPLNGFDSSRLLFFGSWSRTFLVMQISTEFGWARGFDSETPLFQTVDEGAGSFFGTFSLRLTI